MVEDMSDSLDMRRERSVGQRGAPGVGVIPLFAALLGVVLGLLVVAFVPLLSAL